MFPECPENSADCKGFGIFDRGASFLEADGYIPIRSICNTHKDTKTQNRDQPHLRAFVPLWFAAEFQV